jgi:hypothetical protein
MNQLGKGVALIGALLLASSAWSASTVPSIEITGISGSPNGCANPGVTVNVINNLPVGNTHSDNFQIFNGGTLLFTWTGESYDGTGPSTYGINSSPTSVPANTIVTGVIYTFATATIPASPPYPSSVYTYRSQIQWNCTTGALVGITNSVGGTAAGAGNPIPTLQPLALAALSLLLGGGALLVRRRS